MKEDNAFVMNPWPQERAVAASAAIRASSLTPREKRANREAAQRRARRSATRLWALEAFFVPAEAEPGVERPIVCNNVEGVVSHRLLWIAPNAAICSGGGCQGAVRELVLDSATKKWRVRPNHDPVARLLAIELFKERCVDGEADDVDDARVEGRVDFDGNHRLISVVAQPPSRSVVRSGAALADRE